MRVDEMIIDGVNVISNFEMTEQEARNYIEFVLANVKIKQLLKPLKRTKGGVKISIGVMKMTYNELNEIRILRKKIASEQIKLKALKDCAESAGTLKLSHNKVSTKNTVSRVEVLTVLMIDIENEINNLQRRLVETIPVLTAKIQSEVKDTTEQALLIYRYISCEYFRDIGFLMGYSENWVYWKHKQILKKFRVD